MLQASSGKLPGAISAARLQLRMKPKDAEAAELLGLLLQRSGENEQSLHYLRLGAQWLPDDEMHLHNFAGALLRNGIIAEAIQVWQRACTLHPHYALAWMGITSAHLANNDAAQALETSAQGLALQPHWPILVCLHANALTRVGRREDAIHILQTFLQQNPEETTVRSNLLVLLNYTARDPKEIFVQHQAFGNALPKPAALSANPEAFVANATLRLGVLSSDLRNHSVASFSEAFLCNAPANVKVIIFSNAQHEKDKTVVAKFKAAADRWHDVALLDDAALDQKIRSERIDVLLELNGHTSGDRLHALARKPAPVIVSAIGYPNTTGMSAIDWRIVDSITDPLGSEILCTEKLLRLDPCFLCFTPPQHAPMPRMPEASQPITFGSFNNAAKIGAETVALWSSVLRAIPQSRLLLKSQWLLEAAAREDLLANFALQQVQRDRIELLDYAPNLQAHLLLYQRMHVALDTLPYNGTTTTCEALWMGVPVIALRGDRHAARVSASLLTACGMQECIAENAENFIHLATTLAKDLDRLRALRVTLRATLSDSILLDSANYAARFYGALRGCQAQSTRTQ